MTKRKKKKKSADTNNVQRKKSWFTNHGITINNNWQQLTRNCKLAEEICFRSDDITRYRIIFDDELTVARLPCSTYRTL